MRLALGTLLLLAAPAAAQPGVPPVERYKAAVDRLIPLIEREVRDKRLPALSAALVDDQRVVWARGFGRQDRDGKTPATAETVYRVGSVSRRFTDVAVMRLVEDGKLDLDAPVAKYLPGFAPANPFNADPITLRMLMSHRSGLVREPPVGNYFDPTPPTLAGTVDSLRRTSLVYPPGKRLKYSNAAIAVVGRVLEATAGEPFDAHVRRRVLAPLGMAASDFVPSAAVTPRLAAATMWTVHGREFPAPTFELDMAPAGSLYSTVLDLSKFLSAMFDGGGPVLKPDGLAAMLKPQFGDEAFGLGFALGTLDGRRRVGHGGAIYGFATELAALPDDKLGVVVVASRDLANAVTTRLADDALRLMLAVKKDFPLPDLVTTSPLEPNEAKGMAGRYRGDDRYIDVEERGGRAFLVPGRGGFRAELRRSGGHLRLDDVHAWGPTVERTADGGLKVGDRVYAREPAPPVPPPDAPAKWAGLIGEYGWDHNTLYVFEKDGRLHALIEWAFQYPLTEEGENTYAFPDFGLYHGEKIVFERDTAGRAKWADAAGVRFQRRTVDGEGGKTFRIVPRRPLADVRAAAMSATPPKQPPGLRPPDLVDLTTVDATIKLDVRYAGANNFMSAPLYLSARAFLQRPAAEALGRVNRKLRGDGVALLVHDGYRPWHVTKMFWDATPDEYHNFVADPATGSRHNRGCAVDLGLYDLGTGKPVEVVSGYDEFSDRAYPNYPGGTSRQRWFRNLLRERMEAEGFTVYSAEWWHFDYKDWREYPLLNLSFEQLGRPGQ